MRGERRFLLIGGAGLLVLCAVAAYVFAFPSDQQKKELEALCGGLAETRHLDSVLETDEVRAGHPENEGGDSGELEECEARGPDQRRGRVTFQIGDETDAGALLREIGHRDISVPSTTSAPLGGGWPGMVTLQGDRRAHATVLLPCEEDHPEGRVAVNVTADVRGADFSEGRVQTAALARTASGTAEKVAREKGCGNTPEERTGVIAQTPSWTEGIAATRASRSCRAVRDVAAEAKKWGITQVAETRSDRDTPVEECLLLDSRGRTVYRLTALHDVFADAFRGASLLREVSGPAGRDEREGGWAWGSAKCAEGAPRSLYAVSNLHETDRAFFATSPEFETRLVNAFAKRSAERRDCEDLRMP
ncbi:hypothetical protein [Streptomyces sp. ODS28]|uniref:hypothetical protein n=1 Tax=Streptomyces sp. ODS28 TaxID=3136688 RepID=UPI0031E5702F